jgi:hypothetical protein
MKRGSKRLKIVGCLPLDPEGVGFALPVLIHSGDLQLLAIQDVDELSGRVSNFLIFDNKKSKLIYVDGPSIGIGELPIYAFFLQKDSFILGLCRKYAPTWSVSPKKIHLASH